MKWNIQYSANLIILKQTIFLLLKYFLKLSYFEDSADDDFLDVKAAILNLWGATP